MDTEQQSAEGTVIDDDTLSMVNEDMSDSVGQRIRAKLFGGEEPLGTVDRFKLEGVLGTGGMGTVYEGWDEKLQRRVALKFLRGTVDSPSGEKRFFREAQGLARISHPNVVPVYDVGRWEGRVWIAMEHVPGQTLGEWVAEAPRTRAEIVDRWTAAGRGLAAIHDAGMVHRDIKPNNILLGDDGRVRIIDFGLVKAADTHHDLSEETGGDPTIEDTQDQLSESLTNVGSFVGTPAYAAPEHWDGRGVDARSDQYSFCVGLWEVLCGARPPRSEREPKGLVALPEGVRLPKWLHHPLSRGLALEARDRFDDMHGLLAALAPRRRRWLAPALAALTTALVVGGIGLALTPEATVSEAVDLCAQAAAPIDAIWTQSRRLSLAAQVVPTLATRAPALVDGWAESWSNAATSSCEDVHVLRHRSEDSLDRRGLCLDRSLEELEAFMLAVDEGSVTTAQALIEWFGVLSDPQACLCEAVLRDGSEAPPAEHAEEIATLRRQLILVGISGPRDYGQRIEVAKRVHQRAEELGHQPLLGEASLALGELYIKVHETEAARTELGRALDIGAARQDIELSADAWSALFGIESRLALDRSRASWALSRHAALFDGLEPGPRRRARLLHDRAVYLVLDSRLGEAEATLREALPLYEAAGVSATWEQATALHTLGWVLSQMGEGDAALAAYASASELELGSPAETRQDSSAASKLLDESIGTIGAGDYARGRAQAIEGLELAISEQGPRGELVARYHVVIAAACNQLGDTDCVRAHSELADTISMITVGPTNLFRVDVLSTVGVVALADERPKAAVDAFEQALTIARQHTDADSIEVGTAEANFAAGLHAAGQFERARPLATHALDTLGRRLSPDHPVLIPVLILLAELELERKNPPAARELVERAAAMVVGSDTQTHEAIDELLARCRE